MIITEAQMYWLTRLDYIQGFAIGLAGMCGVTTLLIWVMFLLENVGSLKRSAIATIITIMSSAFIFIPSTKEMCAIKAIPMVINNKEVQQLPEKVLQSANEYLDNLNKGNKDEN